MLKQYMLFFYGNVHTYVLERKFLPIMTYHSPELNPIDILFFLLCEFLYSNCQ